MLSKKEVKIIGGIVGALSIVMLIGLIYAAFTGQLNIAGSGVSRISKWDIHFENLSTITTSHTAKVLAQPRLASGTSIVDYSVSVTSPGDTISFTVDVVNEGNYNAEITSVSVSTPSCSGDDSTSNNNVCNHLHYSLTYDSGASVQVGDTLYAKETNKMKVTLTYDDTVIASELPTEEVSISNLGITITFEQSSDALVKENGEAADYKVYKQGDKITLNNEDYWVIEKSGAEQDYIVALKDTPLNVSEVNLYGGVGTENNHVNVYDGSGCPQTACNINGYGALAYYTSETCGLVNGTGIGTGCTSEYDSSEVKYVVDAWAVDKFENDELKTVNGYSSRLITAAEYGEILNTFSWRYNSSYNYLTMTGMTKAVVYCVRSDGSLSSIPAGNSYGALTIRPVINVYKSAISQS